MSSTQKLNKSEDYSESSPTKPYINGNSGGGNYSTPTLPNINAAKNDLNKSSDYANTNMLNGRRSRKKSSRNSSKRNKNAAFQRAVNEEGSEMFNALMEQKTSELQMNMVVNRLKRLEYEEQRARDKIYRSQVKAMKLQQQQQEKERELRFKQRWQLVQDRDLQNQRRQNTLDRLQTKQNINNHQAHNISVNKQK